MDRVKLGLHLREASNMEVAVMWNALQTPAACVPTSDDLFFKRSLVKAELWCRGITVPPMGFKFALA